MHSRRPFLIVAFAMILALVLPSAAIAQDGNPFGQTYTLLAQLSGQSEAPPADPDGFGFAKFTVNVEAGEVCYQMSATNIATATAAHIHAGAAGTNGPVVIPLTAPAPFSNGCVEAEPTLLMAILSDPAGYYANVHNPEYPGGAVRGQLSLLGGGTVDFGTLLIPVAEGLDNPHGIDVGPDGALYVAESGVGGECVEIDPELTLCFGETGKVSRIAGSNVSQVGPNLMSLGFDPSGFAVSGPTDVSWDEEGNLHVVTGLGADPAERDAIGGDAANFGVVFELVDDAWVLDADIAAHEGEENPDGVEPPDSNPFSITGHVVADAGGNSLVMIDETGATTTIAVFPPQMTVVGENPFGIPPGTELPMEAVPTSVTMGSDGAYYVGELTGFPGVPGMSRVWRVWQDDAGEWTQEVYATGFTSIIDLEWHDGHLYILEIAKDGWLAMEGVVFEGGDPSTVPGALYRLEADGSATELASEGLVIPGGLAINDAGHIFVTTYSIFPDMGQVVRVIP